jgi:hypothetical protein
MILAIAWKNYPICNRAANMSAIQFIRTKKSIDLEECDKQIKGIVKLGEAND